MHVPYILPLRPIDGYSHKLNEQMVPVALVPPQDIAPWKEALHRLTTDRAHWDELARLSRATALAYAEPTTIDPFERFISGLQRKPRSGPAAFSDSAVRSTLEALARTPPAAGDSSQETSGCRHHSGASFRRGSSERTTCGCSAFRTPAVAPAVIVPGRRQLEDVCDVACVQYPGHESRRSERLATSLEELVATLAADLKPVLDRPIRPVRAQHGRRSCFRTRPLAAGKSGHPAALALIVSGARAPQYRLNHQPGPDPSPEEFLAQLQRLGGLPAEVESNQRLMDSVLPALAADAALFRRYSYQPEPPLAIPILALGGISRSSSLGRTPERVARTNHGAI